MPESARRSGPGFRRLARRGTDRALGLLGYEILAKHFYSPVPDLEALDDGVWTRRSALGGVALDLDAGLAFLRDHLAELLAEYQPPRRPTGDPRDFYLDNNLYGQGDAEVLHAVVRRLRPERVLELGSGMSTLVIADARAANGGGGWHVACDPFARDDLPLRDVADVRDIAAQEVPDALVAELRAGDVLFVDTTHAVKIGGDVTHVFLDMLPQLAPGVVVHIHDIFLPWEYPREFFTERRFFWTEQYLLQAFLSFNDAFEVLCPLHALWRERRDELAQLIPSLATGGRPAAFWLRRRPDA